MSKGMGKVGDPDASSRKEYRRALISYVLWRALEILVRVIVVMYFVVGVFVVLAGLAVITGAIR